MSSSAWEINSWHDLYCRIIWGVSINYPISATSFATRHESSLLRSTLLSLHSPLTNHVHFTFQQTKVCQICVYIDFNIYIDYDFVNNALIFLIANLKLFKFIEVDLAFNCLADIQRMCVYHGKYQTAKGNSEPGMCL